MKHTLLIASLFVAALAPGCKPSSEKPAVQTTGTAAQQLDKAQAAAKEASQEMKDYTFAQKAEFAASMRAQLTAFNQSLDELAATIARSSDAVKAEAAPKLAALREQAKQLDKKLGEVTNATSSTWSSIKADSEKAYVALKDGLTQSRQWVSDKIAP